MSVERKPLILIPGERYEEVLRRLDAIRAKPEPQRLEYECEKLKEALAADFGIEITRESLVSGRRYGCLGYSVGANAVRNGQVLVNQGEAYLYCWVYCEDGMFRAENAWGTVYESKLPGSPIIEIT